MEQQNPTNDTFSPAALDRFMKSRTSSASEGSPPPERRRRRVTITLGPEVGASGVFDGPFKLGIEELSSGEEIMAYRRAGGMNPEGGEATNEQALAVAFGRLAMKYFNGRRMTPDEQPEVWEAIGMTGRLAVGTAYITHCTGAEAGDLVEKALATAEIE